MPAYSSAGQILKRNVGWLGTTALGLSGANLTLILIGTLITNQGSFTIPLFVFGMLIGVIANLGYLELVLMYPNKIGGITPACSEAFKPYNPIITNLAGTCYWFAWTTLISYGAVYTATAIQIFLPFLPINLLSIGLIFVAALINLYGLKKTQQLAIPFALFAVFLTLLSVCIPMITNNVNWTNAFHYELKTPFPGFFGSATSFMAGLYLIGWITPAYETVLCYVGQTKEPQLQIKSALFACITIATLYYILAPIVWLGTVGETNLTKDLGLSLAPTFAPYLGGAAKIFSLCLLIFNMVICILAPLAATPRTLWQLAQDGYVPKRLTKLNKHNAPTNAILVTALTASVVVLLGSPMWLIAATNFQYLLCISLASIAVWLLRKDKPNVTRLYQAPKGFVTLGLFTAVIWALSTIFGFQQYGLSTMITGVAFSFFGILLFVWRKIEDKKYADLYLMFRTIHLKLTGTMLAVLVLDAVGYLIAIQSISNNNVRLIVALEDIFVVVAMLTLTIGLVLPGMIAYAVSKMNDASAALIKGTLNDFTHAMQALGRGDLEAAHAETKIYPISIKSKDEIGEMADTFNKMQEKIIESAIALDHAREGLKKARTKLTESNNALYDLNLSLEGRVKERTKDLEEKNIQLNRQICERKKAEVYAANLNKKLIDIARQAGMADITTSILHNIGNVLNPINISVSLLKEIVNHSKIENLSLLATLIEANKNNLGTFMTEDVKGKSIPRYIETLAARWQEDKKQLVSELIKLDNNVQHIKDIIIKQNSLSKILGVTEEVDLKILLEEAYSLSKINFPNLSVTVIRSYNKVEKIIIDRIKLLQILINLIKNGLESIIQSENLIKELYITYYQADEYYFVIKITDTGVGVSSENLTKIFSHGFTTKKSGHGFGLHSSALTAAELGGELRIESKGLGEGATFILTLPNKQDTKKIDKKIEPNIRTIE